MRESERESKGSKRGESEGKAWRPSSERSHIGSSIHCWGPSVHHSPPARAQYHSSPSIPVPSHPLPLPSLRLTQCLFYWTRAGTLFTIVQFLFYRSFWGASYGINDRDDTGQYLRPVCLPGRVSGKDLKASPGGGGGGVARAVEARGGNCLYYW